MIQVNAYESVDGCLYKTASEANRADKLAEFRQWYPTHELMAGEYPVNYERIFNWLHKHSEQVKELMDKK